MTETITQTPTERWGKFFQFVFGDAEGYVCIAKIDPHSAGNPYHEEFFQYPQELLRLTRTVERWVVGANLYFCPMMFSRRRRVKEAVVTTTCAWADLDDCDPEKLLVAPSVLIESSPKRYQALWCFDGTEDPADAEELSRRIAYFHAEDGADPSGWDLTQLIRVPYTYNMKYLEDPPHVKVLSLSAKRYNLDDFAIYPRETKSGSLNLPFPSPEEIPTDPPEDLLAAKRLHVHPTVWRLFVDVPSEDWSKHLFQLVMALFESKYNMAETFYIAKHSACNKFERDGSGDKRLWADICRIWGKYQLRINLSTPMEAIGGDLLSDDERRDVSHTSTVVEEYIQWARTLGDAAWQYHQAGAFIALSSLLAGAIRLPTSFGVVIPNLWFMILADTTLTRKTTAMDLSIDVVSEIDSDAILATDGSIEGLFTSLSTRPGRPSVFLRDEFSGLLEAMVKKDYYAGMAETLTKLYDGKFQKRVLRKEVIEVRSPVLILFAGGIKSRSMELLTSEQVASGFLPRFVFITAESDITKLKPLGPPTDQSLGRRGAIIDHLRQIWLHYNTATNMMVEGKTITGPRKWDAILTPEAWARYNRFEADMLTIAMNGAQAVLLTPTFDRLAKSGLKVALLLAAVRKLEENVVVEEEDICRAISYVEQWQHYTLEVIHNIGKTQSEKLLDTVLNCVQIHPGVFKSFVMRTYHLNARETDAVLTTLDQRGQISRVKEGKGERLFPIEGGQ